MNYPPGSLIGMQVRTNPLLTVAGPPVKVRRAWRERLFSRPWKPWRATRTVIPQIPDPHAMLVGNLLIMHPDTWARMRRELDERGATSLSTRKNCP